MYKLSLILSLLFIFGGCTSQTTSLSPHTYSPYSLEALDARYKEGRR